MPLNSIRKMCPNVLSASFAPCSLFCDENKTLAHNLGFLLQEKQKAMDKALFRSKHFSILFRV